MEVGLRFLGHSIDYKFQLRVALMLASHIDSYIASYLQLENLFRVGIEARPECLAGWSQSWYRVLVWSTDLQMRGPNRAPQKGIDYRFRLPNAA